MNHKLAIIHTTPVTIEPLKALAAEILPGWQMVNFVDDSILPQLRDNGGDVSQVTPRLCAYAKFSQEAGADIILEACSSVGEAVAEMRRQVSIPVVRIDDAMAEDAVRRGSRIGVAATVPMTLNPTVRLLHRKAAEIGRQVEVRTLLAEAAYARLLAGDRQGHDEILAAQLRDLTETVDVVVLAQASMARVVESRVGNCGTVASPLPASEQGRYLTSPRGAMLQVKATAEALATA